MTVRVIETFQEPHVSSVTRKNTVYEGAVVEVDTTGGARTLTHKYAAFLGPTVAVRSYRCPARPRRDTPLVPFNGQHRIGSRVAIGRTAGREYAGQAGTVVGLTLWYNSASDPGDRTIEMDGTGERLVFEGWMLLTLTDTP